MTTTTKTKRTWNERFWGRMAHAEMPARVVGLVFVATSIAAMSFCQLGFWPIGIIDDKPVYLMLVLGPLVMGALMFGPYTGALLGLYAGTILFAHMNFFALDFYELYFMSPLNSFVLFTALGALSGVLFNYIARHTSKDAKRIVLTIAACLVISFAASALTVVNTIWFYGGLENIALIREWLINSPLGLTVQALIDAALMVLLCLVVNNLVDRVSRPSDERTLQSMFRNWMLLVSSIVFMLSSAVIFSVTTNQAESSAGQSMNVQIENLQREIEALGMDYGALLLNGYNTEIDGYFIITDKAGKIIASNDEERYPVDAPLITLLGYDNVDYSDAMDAETYAELFFASDIDSSKISEIQSVNEDGVQTMDADFFTARAFDGGYIALLKTPPMVYKGRFETMLALTILAIVLIAAIDALASLLLNRVVVRRIDETNESLGRITKGHLSERVSVHDSREFASLSSGINTTVTALKDTIAEVEQRNAQDLATAKAIQESALPRVFPPFPEIDRFDVYASMKTAKEVGGDFYDFFLIEDGNQSTSKLGFVMADVSGKGIPAALFMMAARTQVRNYMEAGLDVGEAVNAANHQLCIGNDAGMFVTAWVGVLDYDSGHLSFVNAGHNPPLLRRDGAWEWVKDVSGMPLGLFDGMPYDQYELELQPEDMLYAYTDGVTEAMNADDELFGEERLKQTLDIYGDMNPRSVGVGVRRAITDFTLDAEQSDDITMLILKYGVPPEKRAVMILPADVKQLIHVFNFVHEELGRRRAPKSVYSPLDIAAEELFVNVCHYAYPDATPENPGEVRIGFEYEANPPSLTVTISDDGIPYDPLAKPDAVTPDNVADVPIGGLGILMAKRSVDEMHYERVNDSNVLTFVKRW